MIMTSINKDNWECVQNRNNRRSKFKSIFMKVALTFSVMSTCAKIKVGAVIVKNNRIISTGFNGTPSGIIHCEDYFLGREVTDEEHKLFSFRYELHAEMNALSECLKSGLNPENAEMYVTHSPSSNSAKMILASGIAKVFYLHKCDDVAGIELLNDNFVPCKQIELGD